MKDCGKSMILSRIKDLILNIIMKHDKLVRDKIPEIIRERGEDPVTRIADDEEYWQKLKDKLKEEVYEYIDEEKASELADILEVIHAICDFKNLDKDELEEIRKSKLDEKGGFSKRIILEKSLFS